MGICNIIKNIHTTDHIYDYISSLDYVDVINQSLSNCKSKEERISLLQDIRPKMDAVTKAFLHQHPDWIKVRALLP